MRPDEVAEGLQENERKILLALRDKASATTSMISAETGLSRDAVEKASAWAETKGVVSFTEEVSRFFKLTDEGTTYAEKELPEKRLVKLVASGESEISKIRGSLPTLSIALVWVRNNGWATIK
ncbi:hypothetical protein MUO93_03580, partial [Candidatus Bathyarchaeota archaeon]|nr:hypothetical protein [Candidatus Bathyarchaeota archaeon]